MGYAVVIPGSDTDIRGDMVLEGAAKGPYRGLLITARGAFPGEHGTLIPVLGGITNGSGEPLIAILQQRGRDLGMQEQKGRIHPDLRVPKGMAIIAETA